MIKKVVEFFRSVIGKNDNKENKHCEFPLQSFYDEGTKQAEDWERGCNLGLTLASLDEDLELPSGDESEEFYEGLRYGWMAYGYDD